MIADSVTPSNTGRGYVLRRLLRRVFTKASTVKLPNNFWVELIPIISAIYNKIYPEIKDKFDAIASVVKEEEKLFKKPFDGIERYRIDLEATKFGIMKKAGNIPILKDKNIASGLFIFTLFERHGNPIELLVSTAKDLGFKVDEDEINKAQKEHQEKSRTASVGMFKGGLSDAGEEAKKLHTATHLLNAALRQVLGNHVMQKGSNITGERLRFDFAHSQKMTEEEKKKVEEIVNDKIAEKLPVGFVEMPKADAEKIATHSFNEKYGDMVKVYSVGDEKTGYFSREFCGGPHISNTGELGKFKIQKEEAVAQGIRRIKATLS